jgi:hypothetical protein
MAGVHPAAGAQASAWATQLAKQKPIASGW